MDIDIQDIIIPLVAFLIPATGLLIREIHYRRKAKRQAADDSSKVLKDRKKLLEEMVAKAKDADTKNNLLAQLDEVNAALIGLYAKRLRKTLKDAGLPQEEELIADGRRQLKPKETAELESIIKEVNALPPFFSTRDLLSLGNAYYSLGKYKKAKNIYSRIIAINPYDHDAFQYRGAANSHMEKYKEALADFNRSIELNPNDYVAIHDRGTVLYNLEMYDKALTDYNRALKIKPNEPTILINRGNVYAKLGRYDEALVDYNRSLELRPDNTVTLDNRGFFYLKLGEYDKALADFNRSLELEPENRATLYNMACLFSLQGKTKDALAHLKRAIDKDKKYREEARTDEDFDNIRDDPRFKKLVGEG